MIVEGLGKLTFVNGLLRVQALKINTDGEFSESGTIELICDCAKALTEVIAAAAKAKVLIKYVIKLSSLSKKQISNF